MPHARVLFSKNNQKVRGWFTENKDQIHAAVAEASGYNRRDIALIGELLDPDFCSNILEFEVVLFTGKKNFHDPDSVAEALRGHLNRLEIAKPIPTGKWGIWVIPNRDTCYLESGDHIR